MARARKTAKRGARNRRGDQQHDARRGRGRLARLALLLLGLAVIIALMLARTPSPASAQGFDAPPLDPGGLPPSDALGAPDDAFPDPSAEPLRWPRDHAAKLEQRAEYWLFAGRLADAAGQRYGFQLALFRIALAPEAPEADSPWAARDIYRAQLVIGAAGGAARAGERHARGALGLSGAETAPVRVWVEDWQIAFDEDARAFDLRAGDGGLGLELRVTLPDDAPVELSGPGHRGYWWPGLAAEGTLRLADGTRDVAGRALLDRLWGRALPIGGGQIALTRLWLELEDGRALRCRQLRRRSGGGTPAGECLLRGRDGTARPFGRRDMAFEPRARGWRALNGIRYPLRWELELEAALAPLRIAPFAETDEAPFALPLWSAPVRAQGAEGGDGGWGLLELSNYGTPREAP